MTTPVKTCKECGAEKPVTEFRSNGVRPTTGAKKYKARCRKCESTAATPGLATAKAIEKMIEDAGIDPKDIGSIDRVKVYQQGFKDNEGEGHVQDLIAFEISPTWASGPQWEVVDRPPVPVLKLSSKVVVHPKGKEVAMVLPDIQGGFFRLPSGELVPTHDEAALQVVIRMANELQPTRIIMVGDNLDFPEFSTKFMTTEAFAGVTNHTIRWGVGFLAALRQAAPNAEIEWLEGNHDMRLPTYLMSNARAAYSLRRGTDDPEGWPVLSVPYLLAFDQFKISYKAGYPSSTTWINHRLRVIHGHLVRNTPGGTAAAYIKDLRHSLIYGHIHRREQVEVTRSEMDGPRTIMAASPGCLCRIDGYVPSVHQGHSQKLDGAPVGTTEDWQQGLAVVTYEPGDGLFNYESVPIFNGVGLWRDQEIHG